MTMPCLGNIWQVAQVALHVMCTTQVSWVVWDTNQLHFCDLYTVPLVDLRQDSV
jgi:hypothetical protein